MSSPNGLSNSFWVFPAEAIRHQTGQHPAIPTNKILPEYTEQFEKTIGFGF